MLTLQEVKSIGIGRRSIERVRSLTATPTPKIPAPPAIAPKPRTVFAVDFAHPIHREFTRKYFERETDAQWFASGHQMNGNVTRISTETI